jgi:diphthamide biosynthesis protein 3
MSIYEEVEFEDLDYDPLTQTYTYPCPCGDKFSITLEALWDGEDIATCPSCTLRIEIIYEESDLPPLPDDEEDDGGEEEEEGAGEEKKSEDDDVDSLERGTKGKDVDGLAANVKGLAVK